MKGWSRERGQERRWGHEKKARVVGDPCLVSEAVSEAGVMGEAGAVSEARNEAEEPESRAWACTESHTKLVVGDNNQVGGEQL